MDYKYSIFQIEDIENVDYAFRSYKKAAESGFTNADYELKYSGELTAANSEEALDELFTDFNLHRPEDFRGHSLSVSDVVGLKQEGQPEKYYYCDSFGWVDVTKEFEVDTSLASALHEFTEDGGDLADLY